MICEKCNNNMDDDSKFCPYCGNKVNKEVFITNQIEKNIEFVKVDENISNNEIENLEKNITSFNQFYFSHHGSIGRKEFFFRGFLPLFCLSILSMILVLITSEFSKTNEFFKLLKYISLAFSFFIFVIVSNITVKRLHDTNLSGWRFIFNLIPIINILFFLFLVLMPSSKKSSFGLTDYYKLEFKSILLSGIFIVLISILLIIYGMTNNVINQNM